MPFDKRDDHLGSIFSRYMRNNMRKAHLFIGLAILLWGTSTAIGQGIFGVAPCKPLCDPCESVACDPCEPICDPCGNGNSNGGLFSAFTFGGWIEAGVYTNSRNSRDNGLVHLAGNRRNDFQMNQLYLFGEREMNTSRGFDWGGRIDLAYGSDYELMQTADGTFDANWGTNKHGYGMAAYQLYGTLGYRDLSVKIGKFATPLGWEAVASKDNFFYSHSLCFLTEPTSHTGVLATYDVSDRLSLNAGWTTGMDSSFNNPNGNSALLSGFTFALMRNANVYYWINAGKQYDGVAEPRNDFFVQSLCLEWEMTKRFTNIIQYNLRNDNYRGAGGAKDRYSAYGINNHFLYKLTDKLSAGTRLGWLRNNGANERNDNWEVTWGLRWDPTNFLSIRPEVRYDWCQGDTPFGNGKKDQVSGGFGMVVSF